MALAIFDLDNTLLGGDSDHSWGEFLIDQGIVDAASYRRQNDRFYQDYQNGTLDIVAYQRFALSAIKGRPMDEIKQWRNLFMEQVIEPIILPKAVSLLEQHRQAGDFLLIITATNDFITGPIAERLGVDELLATQGEIKDGFYSGDLVGTPCYKEGKVTRLNEWLLTNPYHLEGSYFYSDSHSDLALLKKVTHPIAVNPDPTLHSTALSHNWPVLDLRT